MLTEASWFIGLAWGVLIFLVLLAGLIVVIRMEKHE